MSVVSLPQRRRPPAKPPAVIRESVTAEERAAADELHRKACAIQRLFGTTWATPAALAKAPDLIAEAEEALATLRELVAQ